MREALFYMVARPSRLPEYLHVVSAWEPRAPTQSLTVATSKAQPRAGEGDMLTMCSVTEFRALYSYSKVSLLVSSSSRKL